MDKTLRTQITAEVRAAMTAALEIAEERWINEAQLSKQFACFSEGWLKHHAHELPRTKIAHTNRWVYPMHKINRMMTDGSLVVLGEDLPF